MDRSIFALKKIVRDVIVEVVGFDGWLSPEVVGFLVREYALTDDDLGELRWSYSDDLGNAWGQYTWASRQLLVNRAKTTGLFAEQVKTILHEIQHWNQHVMLARKFMSKRDPAHKDVDPTLALTRAFSRSYAAEGSYSKNRFEIDAKKFERKEFEGAMRKLSNLFSTKIEGGGTFDEAIEEFIDEHDDT